ncbi:CpsD/CapB family tyrosine-protein kinase [Clostridium cellulovorans]|uniref:non-specific protein-tyrosine kinase n=1 Tax=Clostridium cellulovorans (strain ATCC 35296 / DSM 3052 / OCM 3 / 743B) TaxID=573061 RepID=D9SVC7_CLOC7|nr:CpsD/CapB family tyrosine-protein kinase [Clostridium cellulovorans]ADL51051.1 capsular exopolysaccharide family [Clostridium cellulovorans 743B]
MFKSLITYRDPDSITSEIYRTLKTKLQFVNIDNDIRTLLVTSASKAEGKSTTTANLAITVAQSGRKVLIIDSDIRKPYIHKLFSLPNKTGLTTVLTNQCDLMDAIQETEVDNLHILCGGKIETNSHQLIGSKKMSKLIDLVENNFDMVIIDGPPILLVTDSQLLANQVDGVLLVTCYGKTEKKALVKAKKTLDSVNANTLGVVITKVPKPPKIEENYSYYYSEEDDDE